MSLLNKNNVLGVRDYLFAGIGLLCVFWFFLSYPSQEPRSAIDMQLDKNAARQKAVDILGNLGYSTQDVNPMVTLKSDAKLLDSLQAHLGRQKAVEILSDSLHLNLYPYYWDIRLLAIDKEQAGGSSRARNSSKAVIRLNEQGELIAFNNVRNLFPSRKVDREALIAAFEADPDLKLWKSLPDSSWDRILKFNMDEDYRGGIQTDTANTERSEEQSHTYTKGNIEKLAAYHLQNSGWKLSKLELSDIQIETIRSQTVAEVVFNNRNPLLGQNVKVTLTVLPTGSLINLNANFNPGAASTRLPSAWGFVRIALLFCFAFATIVLFYFRIRSRVIDTTPALVVGVLGGLLIPVIIFLRRWATTPLFSSGADSTELLSTALQMGFSGAITAIGFFIAFSVGDSLLRQYWADKLYYYDYLRQGMFFNKPVGEMLLRSVVLAFILCGLWSTILGLFPDLYFNVEHPFLHHQAAWAPIYLLADSAWFSLILIVGVFAVVGTQVYGLYKNEKIAGSVMVIALVLVTPFMQSFGPDLQEMAISAIMGVALATIFIKWDLVTTLCTHFLFILMLKVSGGWITSGSPDFYLFLFFCGFLLLLVIAGLLFITTGKEQQSLSAFVPEYVEELAQEERIKQELQIAREVQQSFLPVETPRFRQLDLAAICQPAYETGGDYYDFIQLDKNRVAVTIGDVSGKSIQAAFYMTFIKGILHSLCHEIDSPVEVLKKTNRLFYDNAPRGTFISLVYGIMDIKKNTFHFARAGHNPVIKLNARNEDIREFCPRGIGIGLAKGDSFDNNIVEKELTVSEDDLLVLYTDGIVEALNEQHEFFGTQRLNDLLMKYKNRSAAQILQYISNDLHEFIGVSRQHDDMTMLIMKLQKKADIS